MSKLNGEMSPDFGLFTSGQLDEVYCAEEDP
jgi:hypothetical protein